MQSSIHGSAQSNMPRGAISVEAAHEAPHVMGGKEMLLGNAYRPWPARITSMRDLTAHEKLFEFRLIDERVREAFVHEPGQFLELSLFGVGEVPISITSSPTKQGFVELCIRRAGTVTSAIHGMRAGDIVGLRGPFGRGFPVDEMRGNDILVVAGGLGIAPVRSLINYIHDNRSDFGRVTIVYGSRTPADIMFRDQFEMWRHRADFELYLTVDNPDDAWDGEVGVVTEPMKRLDINPDNTFGVVCGPPVMYKFVVAVMREKNIDYDHIYLDFERHMKCGMGKCGHCQIGHQYCCIDGPVFNYWEAKNIQGSM